MNVGRPRTQPVGASCCLFYLFYFLRVTRVTRGLTRGRIPSGAALTGAFSNPLSEVPPVYPPPPPPAQLGHVQAGFPWIALPTTKHFHRPHSTAPHPSRLAVPTRLPDALGYRPSAEGGQGVTLFLVRRVRLTPKPTHTRAIDPVASGSTLTPADASRLS